MPIVINDLLQPISPGQPAGADIRYATVTDDIREARRSEDAVAQGVWKRETKTADYARVITLARDTLAKKSKDLQIAGWLAEALLAREGFKGLQQGLELIHRLLENFWDTVYPTIDEDGDLEMRATPLRWVGSQLTVLVRSAPITQTGINWVRYRESRSVPTEEEANSNSDKGDARREAIEDGRLTPEEWAEAYASSSVGFYQNLSAELKNVQDTLSALSALCDERFSDDPPDFGPLRSAIEEVDQTVRVLVINKGGRPAGEQPTALEPEPEPEEPVYAEPVQPAYDTVATTTAAAAAPRMARSARASASAEPQDAEDAMQRIIAAAHYLRQQDPMDPVPYLVVRALRWGEIRKAGLYADPGLAEAPPSQARVELKRLSNEGDLPGVLTAAENVMAQPCGRAWLDLQRYVVRACRNMGYGNVAHAVASELRALIADYPQILKWTMMDDTPVANAETMEWMQEEHILPEANAAPAAEPPSPPVYDYRPPPPAEPEQLDEGPDPLQLALDAARSGRLDEALDIIAREIRQAASGRVRFQRRVELAQICLSAGKASIAAPVLRELADEIEQRRLEDWEAADLIAQPLSLLYRCLDSDEARQKVYERVCRLDPVRALNLGG